MRQKTFHSYSLQKIILLNLLLCLLFVVLGSCAGGGGDGDSNGGGQYAISGRITSGGAGLAQVTVTLTGANPTVTTTTDAQGNYQFSNVANGFYEITPSKATYIFSPSSRTVFVTNAQVTGQDFTATVVTWARTYGGIDDDLAHSIQQTADGGFIVAGETFSFGEGNSDVWVLRLDVFGNIQWEKTYGGSGYDVGRSVQQTADGGFIVAGETSSFGGNTEVWVLKLRANGDIDWQKRYGGSGDDLAYSIQQTSDGGYIVAGETTSFGSSDKDVFLLKINSYGSIEWRKSYGGGDNDVAKSVQLTSDGGFIVAGETSSFGKGDIDAWVFKLDADGRVVWQKTYGDVNDDLAYSIQQTSDGGYIVVGGTTPAGSNSKDVLVLKLEANGEIEWQKTYGGAFDTEDVAYSVQQTSDGGYIIAGISSSFGNFFGDIWVLKIRADGEIDWQHTYGGNDSNSATFIRQTSDGGFIVAGETYSFGAGDADVWVLKLDPNGNIGSGCAIVGDSTATPAGASLTALTSSVNGTTSTAVANTTSVSANNSSASVATQCSSP